MIKEFCHWKVTVNGAKSILAVNVNPHHPEAEPVVPCSAHAASVHYFEPSGCYDLSAMWMIKSIRQASSLFLANR